jgi:hypothetical protein
MSYIAIAVLSLGLRASQNGALGYTTDNSDWWSFTRIAGGPKTPVQNREPSPENFQVLGIELDHHVFENAASKLGQASVVERGDAASGRSQVCYISETSGRIHLVFEEGEVNEALYLLEGGPDWKGSEVCVKSKAITEKLHVASGIGLGQSPTEVQSVLGKPSTATSDKLVYSYEVEKHSTADELRKLRQQHPKMSDEDLRRNYASYTLSVYIEARFSQSKLIYLAVSKAETE